MNLRRYALIVVSILLFVQLAGCAKSPASTAAPAVANTAGPVAPAATQASIAASSGSCSNAYYPVSNGNSHTYASSGGRRGDYTFSVKMVGVSDSGFSTSYLFSTGANAIIKWTCQGGNLAELDDGSASVALTGAKVQINTDSLKAEGYSIPNSFESGTTWSEKVTVSGSMQTSGGKTIAGQIAGQYNCKAGGAETITVPAGKFDTITALCDNNVVVSALDQGTLKPAGANHENVTLWYAKGVGFIKSVATGGANNETIQLLQYKIK
ncbi:MAG: hypothetical protein P4L50_28845 [Anaerolineaceae bacterium]|nr:hypothetical protein [Anaerolineaceae bacterium]